MIDIEYFEVVDNICFLVLERLRRRLFVEFVVYIGSIDDLVLVMRLV